MTTRRYRGIDIYPCERTPGQHRGRWIVQTYHSSGVRWADEQCPHFATLQIARDYIDEWGNDPVDDPARADMSGTDYAAR